MHRHFTEILDGRTTSVYHHILGFNTDGEVTNYSKFGNVPWAQIMEDSAKVITLIDVGGNERYTKSLIKGLCVHYPDYALIVVDAEACARNGCRIDNDKNVLDNFRIAFAFQVPVIIVVTKIDCLENIEPTKNVGESREKLLSNIVFQLRNQLWDLGKRVGNVVNDKQDIVVITRQMEVVCPIFAVSNKTLEGIALFKEFLNSLQFASNDNDGSEEQALQVDSEFQVTRIFRHTSQSIILGGIVHKGRFRRNQRTWIGPSSDGTFSVVDVKTIQCNSIPVQSVKAGQLCSLKISIGKHTEKWLRPAARHTGGNIRKGMVLLDYSKKKVQASFSFKAEIWSFDGKVHTIKKTMQPVILT